MEMDPLNPEEEAEFYKHEGQLEFGNVGLAVICVVLAGLVLFLAKEDILNWMQVAWNWLRSRS